jgi:hypothetical protein
MVGPAAAIEGTCVEAFGSLLDSDERLVSALTFEIRTFLVLQESRMTTEIPSSSVAVPLPPGPAAEETDNVPPMPFKRRRTVDAAAIARRAFDAGGLLVGTPDTCPWTLYVLPHIQGIMHGRRIVGCNEVQKRSNNDFLARVMGELHVLYNNREGRVDDDEDDWLLLFYRSRRPNSAMLINLVDTFLESMARQQAVAAAFAAVDAEEEAAEDTDAESDSSSDTSFSLASSV